MLHALAMCIALVLATALAASAQTDDRDAFVGRVIELTNAERENAGLAPLAKNDQLTAAAQGYSDVLASGDCFNHTCGDVPNFADRDAQASYNGWTDIGENIAAGYPTPEAVVAGWMASPGHRANILSPNFSEIGVGVARGGQFGTYWTEEFGSRG